MVMLKLTPLTAEINGRIGNLILWVDQCGQHARSVGGMEQFTPPASARQRQVRNWFRQLIDMWKSHHWTWSEMDAWGQWGRRQQIINRKSQTYTLPPYQAFLSANMDRLVAGDPPSPDPPTA